MMRAVIAIGDNVFCVRGWFISPPGILVVVCWV